MFAFFLYLLKSNSSQCPELVATAKNVPDRQAYYCFCIRAIAIAVWLQVSGGDEFVFVFVFVFLCLSLCVLRCQTDRLLHQGNSDGCLVVGLGWGWGENVVDHMQEVRPIVNQGMIHQMKHVH